jgi:hypothetical protein
MATKRCNNLALAGLKDDGIDANKHDNDGSINQSRRTRPEVDFGSD